MLTLKDLSMGLRVVGILYLFYLQYVNMVNIPMSVVVLISLGSLGTAMSCKLKHTDSYIHARLFNYAIALAGLVIILKEYM
jgi:hypothetical protein